MLERIDAKRQRNDRSRLDQRRFVLRALYILRMRLRILILLLFTAPAFAQSLHEVLGTWEGDSVCVVEDPCHNEHVVYEIAPAKAANAVTIKADKVVNGQRQFMGTLDCTYDGGQHRLSCPWEGGKPGDWVFNVSGDIMTGTLTIREGKQLFRNVRVKRSAAR
jgi:hypothetical protein